MALTYNLSQGNKNAYAKYLGKNIMPFSWKILRTISYYDDKNIYVYTKCTEYDYPYDGSDTGVSNTVREPITTLEAIIWSKLG